MRPLSRFKDFALSSESDECGQPQTTLHLAPAPIFSVAQLAAAWGKPTTFDTRMKAPIGTYRFDAQNLKVVFFSEVGINSMRFDNVCAPALKPASK